MIITGVVLAALLNTANAQFAIENNSKLGAKVEMYRKLLNAFYWISVLMPMPVKVYK